MSAPSGPATRLPNHRCQRCCPCGGVRPRAWQRAVLVLLMFGVLGVRMTRAATGTPQALLQQAQQLLARGEDADAVGLYQQFLLQQPDHPAVESVTLRLAGLYLRLKRLDECEALLRRYERVYSYADTRGELPYRFGELAEARGELEKAVRYFRTVRDLALPSSPFIVLADYRAACCELRLGQVETAATHLRRCAALYDGFEIAERARLALGLALYQQGKFAEAMSMLCRVAQGNVPELRLKAALAGATIMLLGRAEPGEHAWVGHLLGSWETSAVPAAMQPRFLLCRGAVAADMGRLLADWQELVARFPRHWEALYALQLLAARPGVPSQPLTFLARGVQAAIDGNHRTAIAHLRRATAEDARDISPAAWLYVLRILLDLADWPMAAEYAESAARSFPQHPLTTSFLRTAAYARLQINQPAVALAHIAALRENSDVSGEVTPAILMMCAYALLRQNQFEAAGRQFLALAESRPDSPWAAEALLHAATAFRAAGRMDGARRAMQTLERTQPAVVLAGPIAMIERSLAAASAGQTTEAAALLDALSRDEVHEKMALDILLARAEVWERVGDLQKATSALAQAERLVADKELATAVFLWRARLLAQAEAHDTLVAAIGEFLHMYPEARLPAEVVFWFAAHLHASGRYEAAARAVHGWLASDCPPRWRALANFYAGEASRRQGNYAKAVELYERSLAADGTGVQACAARIALAMSLLACDKSGDALAVLDQAADLPAALDLAALTVAGGARLRQGRYVEARQTYARILELFDGPEYAEWRTHATYGMGAVYEAMEQCEAAIAYYQLAASSAPATPWALADRQKAIERLRLLAGY